MDYENHNNRLAMKLTKNLHKNGKNLVISPFSLTTAIGMLLAGAKNHSQIELIKFLFGESNENDSNDKILQQFTDNLQSFIDENKNVLNNANMIYSNQSYPLKDSYVELLSKKFSAIAKQLNFNDQVGSLKEINDAVKMATKEMIPSLLNEIDPETRAILINAIHFKGLWKYPFDKNATIDSDFYKSDGSKISVKMMELKKKKFFYNRFDEYGLQTLVLPYQSGSILMSILLPDKNKTITDIIETIENNEKLSDIFNNLSEREINLKMPKFKIESTHQLIPILNELNVKTIFTAAADLSGISDEKLFVSQILQKAIIEVNEEGTEAAAATAIVMMRCCMVFELETINLTIDRPFIYLLISEDCKHILFTGICENPNEN